MSSEHDRTSESTPSSQKAAVPLFVDVEQRLLSIQELVGRKWIPIIVYHLLEAEPIGFSALKSRIDGISSKMLSESLDDLESAGVVTRELVNERPVRVEYELTERGEELQPLIAEMVRWGAEHDRTGDADASEVDDEDDDVEDDNAEDGEDDPDQTSSPVHGGRPAVVSLEGE